MKTNLLLFICLVLGFLIILAIRPVDSSLQRASSIESIVDSVRSNEKTGDITFYLQGSDVEFYVNRGIFYGMEKEVLSRQVESKAALIHYADHFTPLDPFGRHRHIIQISIGESVIFDENRDPHFSPSF